MPGNDVIRQPPHAVGIAPRGKILERSDANVAGRDAGEDSPRQRHLAQHALAGHDSGERSCGRNAERGHCLADDVFAQHRTERRAAIAAPRKWCWARPLELNVTADPSASITSPSRMARPSPSWGTKWPNWWP